MIFLCFVSLVVALAHDPTRVRLRGIQYDHMILHQSDHEFVLRELSGRWRERLEPICNNCFTALRDTPRTVIDLFLYNDEIDILEIRAATLENLVDYHVVMESNHTHAGGTKRLNFLTQQAPLFDTRCRARLFQYTIKTEKTKDHEKAARKQYGFAVDSLIANRSLHLVEHDTIILYHDIDEIPHPELIWLLKWCRDIPALPLMPLLRYYLYTFGWRVVRESGPRIFPVANGTNLIPLSSAYGPFVVTLSSARHFWKSPDAKPMIKTRAREAGWHCSSCLPLSMLTNKFNSQAKNTTVHYTEQWLMHVKRTGSDVTQKLDGITVGVNPLAEAPDYVIRHQQRFEYMLFPPDHSAFTGKPHETVVHPAHRECWIQQ